jgi:hypothetical protein
MRGGRRSSIVSDDLIPVVFEIALNTVDEQTRATACETAHSLTLIAIAQQRTLNHDAIATQQQVQFYSRDA